MGVCKCFQNEHQLFPGTCMDNALYFPSRLKTSLKILYLKINGKARHFKWEQGLLTKKLLKLTTL